MTVLPTLALALSLTMGSAAADAQTAPQPPTPMPVPMPTPSVPAPSTTNPSSALDVEVVITRLEGGKVVSTLPYTLAVTANGREAQLNLGSEVPVPTTTFTPLTPPTATPPTLPTPPTPPSAPSPADPGSAVSPTPLAPPAAPVGSPRPLTSMNYRSVGTIISCRVSIAAEGYVVEVSVDDSTVFTGPRPAPAVGTMPVFRNFRSRNSRILRDGQTTRYSSAADRVSGEVVRVDVTLRVVK